MLADEGGERRNLGGGKRREISKEMRKGDFFFNIHVTVRIRFISGESFLGYEE